jgi:hypothetical protein
MVGRSVHWPCAFAVPRKTKNIRDGGEVGGYETGVDRVLELVTSDDLGDREKDRSVTAAKFYDIEQRLPFPGITYRIDVVDPVARHRAGADTAACGYAEQKQQGSKTPF